jgi:hypothetical protein
MGRRMNEGRGSTDDEQGSAEEAKDKLYNA